MGKGGIFMSFFIKELVKNKLKQITSDELLHYANNYNFSITNKQAQQITQFLKNNKLDPFKKRDREQMFNQLEYITDKQTSDNARVLLEHIIKTNGLEYLFD